MAYQTSTNNYQNSRFIVGAGIDCYPTIQSAINAANAAGGNFTVFVREGTYTENLTLYSTVHIEGRCDTLTIIAGTHTPPTSGSVVFSNVGLQSATHVISSAAAGTTTIQFNQCSFNITNGYVCNVTNWTGALSFIFCNDLSANNGIVTNTAAAPIFMTNSIMGSGTNVCTMNGVTTLYNANIGSPIALSGNAASVWAGGCFFSKTLTVSGNADLGVVEGAWSTGSATAIVQNSSVTLRLTTCGIRTTNAAAISGSGTVQVNSVTYTTSKAVTATENLSGVLSTGEIYANTITRQEQTGFYSWAASGPYFDDTTLGTFRLLVGGTGYIKGRLVTWVAQNITGMTAGATWYIYIDSTGTIGKVATRTDQLFVDYIVLFECLYDSTPVTAIQHTVKENHPYNFPTRVSNFLHDTIGPVIENASNGANITLVGPANVKISISGADVYSDHGLETTIPDSAGAGVVWKKFYTTAAGKWAQQNSSDTFSGYYNNAGTPTVLGGSKFGVYRLYVSKDTLNATTPTYYAVLDIAQYNTSGAASTAIGNDTPAKATNEFYGIEVCQLGFIIFSQASAQITTVIISKKTINSATSTAGTNTASLVNTNTAAFNGILSAADTNVQSALDTIDNWGAGTTDKCLVVGNGTGVALGVLAVGTTGTILTGVSANDPTWTTATYPATVATGDILSATGTNAIGVIAGTTATSGYVLTGNGSGVAPTWQTPRYTYAWTVQTSSFNLVKFNGYITNHAVTLVVATLPASAAIGDTFEITNIGAAGWKVAQNASQYIYLGNTVTTTGVSGYLSSTALGDSLKIVCVATNNGFQVVSAPVGNITVN